MKKMVLFTVSMFMLTGSYAQEITSVTTWEVLASDDFEKTPWVNFDQPAAELQLNNALGGNQTCNWSGDWGGACIHAGKSAVSGQNCVQLHWGGTLVLQGFEIDPGKIYQLEIAIHPVGGMSGEWNNYSAVHLFIFDSPDVWQQQGIRVRVSNNDATGSSPSWFAYDTWDGEDGVERFDNLLQFHDDYNTYSINDAADATATHFWIPLKLVFTGEGTTENPLIMDFYLNNIFISTEKFENIVWKGDSMIGLQNTADNADITRFDNFKLSVAKTGTNRATIAGNKVTVKQVEKNSLLIQTNNYDTDTAYQLFNVAGIAVAKGVLNTSETTVGNLLPGVYILHLTGKTTGYTRSIRTIVK
jgi:hypothetical protein